MFHVSFPISSQKDADAFLELCRKVFVQAPTVVVTEPEPKKSAKEKLFAERKPVEPTPLETAIAVAVKEGQEHDRALEDNHEPVTDPFEMLSGGDPRPGLSMPATPAEKPKRQTKKKTEDRQTIAEPPPLLLADIRRISDAVCEAIGMDTIREALAKFAAKDEKGTLRMSFLRDQDYALYVEFLNKKMNDAGKERVS